MYPIVQYALDRYRRASARRQLQQPNRQAQAGYRGVDVVHHHSLQSDDSRRPEQLTPPLRNTQHSQQASYLALLPDHAQEQHTDKGLGLRVDRAMPHNGFPEKEM